MNSWGNEQFPMANMMSMPPVMMPGMQMPQQLAMPSDFGMNGAGMHGVPPQGGHIPMHGGMNHIQTPGMMASGPMSMPVGPGSILVPGMQDVPDSMNPGEVPPIIGPVMPDGFQTDNVGGAGQDCEILNENMEISGDQGTEKSVRDKKGGRSSRTDDHHSSSRDERRDSSKDVRGRRRSRSPRHRSNRGDRGDRSDRSERNDRSDRNDRNDRGRNDRNDRSRQDRPSKWDTPTTNNELHDNMLRNNMPRNMPGLPNAMQSNNMVMQGNMPRSNMPEGLQGIMMPGMMQYGNSMQNMMGQMQMDMNAMPNMMPGMNMMGNMMQNTDGSMMMMMSNQPIYLTDMALLPPIPGVTLQNRRERPPGCRTIFIGGLQNQVTEALLHEIFQRFGNITDVKLHSQGFCHVRFEKEQSVEQSFMLSGYRLRGHNQTDSECTTIFIDYALNRDDQREHEKRQRTRAPTPPRTEPYTPAALAAITDKIKSEDQFAEAAPTLAAWLERGECNKRNANAFYLLIQASNNQTRRLFNEKMQWDDEYQTMRATMRDKLQHIMTQFEQVAKILSAAKHQRVSDHLTKQQRRNVEMWLKMTEEMDNLREEFNTLFDEEENENIGKKMVPEEKYEELKREHENLTYELEGYKNEAHLAKDEAERKFEKFKAHFIAQQALQGNKQPNNYPPLPPPPMPNILSGPPLPAISVTKPQPPPPTPDDDKIITSGPSVPPSEGKLISILTAFLLVHPLGASLDYLVSYVRSMVPNATQGTVQNILQKYDDVFYRKTTGVGATIEHRWGFITFDVIKKECP